MEPANTFCHHGESKGGILVHLERLETQRNKSHTKSEELPRAQTSALGTKCHELRRLRDKLRAEVKQRQAAIKASDQIVEFSGQEVLERQQGTLKAILQAYHFTGLSGKLTSHGVCVSISTAFEGNLLDSYFVDLVIERPLWIHHHSIPVFIPLEKIAAKHLQTDIQRFMFSLCEHLNAYSGRKYQADRLESDFTAFLTGPLQRNSLCNLLSFTYKVNQEHQALFSARLLYEDLTGTLPTDVTVMYQGAEALSNSWEKHRLAHERLLLTKPLHQVFASFSGEENLDLNLVS
uniref:Centromere protein O n=1 Tax=Jaculus jaculus TaxID=51337 RepID=A0A8C5L3V6_JACJA